MAKGKALKPRVLVVDDEICGQVRRLVRGITPREDFPAVPRFEELLREGHLLISEHSRRHLREELTFPGKVIERANLSRWRAEGSRTLGEKAHDEVEKRIVAARPSRLPASIQEELTRLMSEEARRHGMDALPRRDS